ncbi:hypothetical protein GQ54DRAFT_299607 [Martensiomyces pterosporus]|nr:hypothetical protein GQ54DRAFT_299607 [Martensiomyces pterosporus]
MAPHRQSEAMAIGVGINSTAHWLASAPLWRALLVAWRMAPLCTHSCRFHHAEGISAGLPAAHTQLRLWVEYER